MKQKNSNFCSNKITDIGKVYAEALLYKVKNISSNKSLWIGVKKWALMRETEIWVICRYVSAKDYEKCVEFN